MVDYQKMYYTLLHATEEALQTLIEAQRACEEMYISGAEDEPEDGKTT